ncbi:S-methyl-5-thioribose-1-phosphate isomerase [Candidatus Bathyarchaeota archaeon]|nr:S-methyl-5-thioribose-1-phosphate isomerase [Candidatus Bathyarchaeota archaeon]
MRRVLEAAKRIRRLEVQGATNVALTAIRALVEQMRESKAKSREEALAEIEEARDILFGARETEPFMRNALRYIEWRIRAARWESVEELNRLMEAVAEEFIQRFREARKRIEDIGSRRILPGTRILTHCHSSAVIGVLRAAKRRGIEFEVICTETRPLYQGRITAKELLEMGVRTTMIVDSAVRTFLKQVDLVLVGADAITSEGNIINKIGTSLIALAAQEARVPFYVVTELLKFDPQTIHGDYEAIEERAASEIWPDAPEGLAIRNPAFDVTRRDYIHGIICEEGVISPHSILEAVRRRYPWILESVGIPA